MDIEDFITTIKKGAFGIVATTSTKPTMRSTRNPYLGRVRKVSVITNVAIGYSYENTVNNRIERLGGERNFKADMPNGIVWVKGYERVLYTNGATKYLRLTMRKNTKVVSTYMIDGRQANEQEIDEIEKFIITPNHSKKQALYGLKDDNEVVVRNVKIESILSLKCGQREYKTQSTL